MVLVTEIEAFLRSLPNEIQLTEYGNILGRGSLVSDPPCPKEDYEATARLFDLAMINSCVLDIPEVFKRATSYSQATSYGLKHAYEARTGKYVRNGEFIVAMALSGFPVKWKKDGDAYVVNPVIKTKPRKAEEAPVTCA
ncbi:hypothetical protein HK097_003746 [Rhizophlyctis rosea]|uniref:Uncharacterized protein n=1 Tax=Rhizophlyctis rosea TaxID=64517 RepID=A0AAD5X0F7_9FUNG|nr:hypothetical protein HK097_003746 [Rhizophlyctis rosea]